MSATAKLNAGQKHIMRLIARDKRPDGWTTVSKMLSPLMQTALPDTLAEFRATDVGGEMRLTEEGQQVLEAMDWL